MAEENKTDNSQQAVDQSSQQTEPDVKGDAVPVKVYEQTKSDMLTYKQEKRDLQAQLEKLQSAKEAEETKRLEEQNQFKDLYEKEKQNVESLQQQMNSYKIQNAVKAEAAKNGALNVNDVNFEKLAGVELKDGEVFGVTEAVQKLKEQAPYLFGSGEIQQVYETAETKPKGKPVDSIKYEDLLKDGNLMAKFKKDHPAEYSRLKEDHLNNRTFGKPRR